MPSYPLKKGVDSIFVTPRTDLQRDIADRATQGQKTTPYDYDITRRTYPYYTVDTDRVPYPYVDSLGSPQTPVDFSSLITGRQILKDILWGALRRLPKKEDIP